MLINVQFLWAHMDILLASLILVITSKTIVVAVVVRAFGYSSKNAFLVSTLLYVMVLFKHSGHIFNEYMTIVGTLKKSWTKFSLGVCY